jgi:hypothetical protein
MDQVPIVGEAIITGVLAHRRNRDAIAEHDVADPQGRKQMGHNISISPARSGGQFIHRWEPVLRPPDISGIKAFRLESL